MMLAPGGSPAFLIAASSVSSLPTITIGVGPLNLPTTSSMREASRTICARVAMHSLTQFVQSLLKAFDGLGFDHGAHLGQDPNRLLVMVQLAVAHLSVNASRFGDEAGYAR